MGNLFGLYLLIETAPSAQQLITLFLQFHFAHWRSSKRAYPSNSNVGTNFHTEIHPYSIPIHTFFFFFLHRENTYLSKEHILFIIAYTEEVSVYSAILKYI